MFGCLARPGVRRPGLVAFLAVALLMADGGAAVADHGGREIGSFLACDRPVTPPRCTSVGDNRLHLVAFDPSLSEGLAVALRVAMEEAYDAPTRLTVIRQGRVTRATDVIAFSGDYGDNGAAGWVYCPDDAPQGRNALGDRWCRAQEMHFNLNPRYGLFFDDDASRRHITCHELGHSLGLHHWGNPPETDPPVGATCMNANTPNGPTRLHPTDIDHINAYPYRVRRVPSRLEMLEAPERTTFVAATVGPSVDANEVDAPTSLEDLVARSDAVVHGRVTAVDAGRTFGPASRPLPYATVRVAVVELVAGSLPEPLGREVALEIPLFGGLEQLEPLRLRLLGSERLLFLRSKGETARRAGLSAEARAADAPFHRLMTFTSELVAVDGRVAVPEGARALGPLSGLPFAEAVARIREIGEVP